MTPLGCSKFVNKQEGIGIKMCKYPHRITIAMTDDMFKQVKQALGLRYMLGDIQRTEPDILLLHICKAIDENETNTVFLRSIKESEKGKTDG